MQASIQMVELGLLQLAGSRRTVGDGGVLELTIPLLPRVYFPDDGELLLTLYVAEANPPPGGIHWLIKVRDRFESSRVEHRNRAGAVSSVHFALEATDFTIQLVAIDPTTGNPINVAAPAQYDLTCFLRSRYDDKLQSSRNFRGPGL